jgi:hypothetical protein
MTYDYEYLNKQSIEALALIKQENMERVTKNESERQQLIREILSLQKIQDHSGWVAR